MPDGGHVGEERWRRYVPAILEQLAVGVLVAEAPGGCIVHANAQLDAIWRGPLPRPAGVEGYADWRGFHPGGRAYRAEEWPLARSLATGEEVGEEELEIERLDGSRGVVRMSSGPIRDEQGQIVAAVASVLDVTRQKQREKMRRLLAEASTLLSSSLDYQATLRNVARLAVPTLADWCGVDILLDDGRVERLAVEHFDPGKRDLASELRRRYPPEPTSSIGVGRVLRSGRAELFPEVAPGVLEEVARDEEHLRLLRELGLRSAMIVPLLARGKTLGALVFVASESGRRYGSEDLELAEELAVRAALAIDNARLYHESQSANRAKADFLAVISHELRTPLTAIIGYSELLNLGVPEPLGERHREQVERIEVAARHLLQLIEEILTMANLEAGQARVQAAPVPVAELLQRALVITQPMASAKELTLRVASVEGGLTVESDPDKLLQVLLGLLSNAVKFTETGEIHLSAERVGEQAVLRVRDTGVGMRPEHLEKIFDPFWQVEQPITRRAGGTGLGLAVTRRIVDLLGGRIEVQSRPGRGSTFAVYVPLRAPVQARPAEGGTGAGR